MKTAPSDTWLRIVIPLALIIASVVSQGLLSMPYSTEKLLGFTRLAVCITLNFEWGRYATIQIQKILPQVDQSGKRLFISYLAGFLVSFLVITISTLISRYQVSKPATFASETWINLVQCTWLSLLIVVPCEVFYSYRLLFKNEKERHELQQINLQNELNQLKEKVNPHFLFNTLNTLSALILKDAHKAENYIAEMCALFRAMLKHHNNNLITLSEELSFVDSYLYLMQERFGSGLKINIEISEHYRQYLVPPLTLQLLIENAIKHNEIAADNPLLIHIVAAGNQLSITNNISKKEICMPSAGIGLLNITRRFELLHTDREVSIFTTDNAFKVIIPLFNHSSYENTDHRR